MDRHQDLASARGQPGRLNYLHNVIRLRRYSIRATQAYVD